MNFDFVLMSTSSTKKGSGQTRVRSLHAPMRCASTFQNVEMIQ